MGDANGREVLSDKTNSKRKSPDDVVGSSGKDSAVARVQTSQSSSPLHLATTPCPDDVRRVKAAMVRASNRQNESETPSTDMKFVLPKRDEALVRICRALLESWKEPAEFGANGAAVGDSNSFLRGGKEEMFPGDMQSAVTENTDPLFFQTQAAIKEYTCREHICRDSLDKLLGSRHGQHETRRLQTVAEFAQKTDEDWLQQSHVRLTPLWKTTHLGCWSADFIERVPPAALSQI